MVGGWGRAVSFDKLRMKLLVRMVMLLRVMLLV